MKALIRPLFVIFAIFLIGMSIRRGMTGGSVDYVSLGLAIATLVLVFMVSRSEKEDDQDDAP